MHELGCCIGKWNQSFREEQSRTWKVTSRFLHSFHLLTISFEMCLLYLPIRVTKQSKVPEKMSHVHENLRHSVDLRQLERNDWRIESLVVRLKDDLAKTLVFARQGHSQEGIYYIKLKTKKALIIPYFCGKRCFRLSLKFGQTKGVELLWLFCSIFRNNAPVIYSKN